MAHSISSVLTSAASAWYCYPSTGGVHFQYVTNGNGTHTLNYWCDIHCFLTGTADCCVESTFTIYATDAFGVTHTYQDVRNIYAGCGLAEDFDGSLPFDTYLSPAPYHTTITWRGKDCGGSSDVVFFGNWSQP